MKSFHKSIYLFSVYILLDSTKMFPSSLQNKNIRISIKPMKHNYKAVNISDHSSHKCRQLCFQMATNDGANLISRRRVSHNTGPPAEQHPL